MTEQVPFVRLDDLIARSEAGEDIRIRMLPDQDFGPFFYDAPVMKGPDEIDFAALNRHGDCHFCDAGHEPTPSPTARSEFASPELQRFKDALDKHSDGDMEIIKALKEYAASRRAEEMKPLFDLVMPSHGIDRAELARDLAALELRTLAHQEVTRHRSNTAPLIVALDGPAIGKTLLMRAIEKDLVASRSAPIVLNVGDGWGGREYIYDEAHMMPKLEIKDFDMPPPKLRGCDYVGRHGDMPVPARKRKKFKPSRRSHTGRRK